MNFNDILEGVFPEDSEEWNVLEEAYNLVISSTPTIAAQAKTDMILLDNSKIRLSTIYFMISRNISRQKESIQGEYDTAYTRLVKLGRPSNAAIESEIRMTHPSCASVLQKIEVLEQVKDLVSSYIKGIDSAKQTAIEFLRDSRRID